jgi:two-component system OmpR family response regulator
MRRVMEDDSKLKVFVVDDDELFRQAMVTHLLGQVKGIVITQFGTGEAFLHELDEEPDVVILDYYLNTEFKESWNGLQVLKKIKAIDPDIAVIMLSSQHEVEIAADLMREGALEYVVKNEVAFSRIAELVNALKDEFTESPDALPETKEEEKEVKHRLIAIVIGIIIIVILLLTQ